MKKRISSDRRGEEVPSGSPPPKNKKKIRSTKLNAIVVDGDKAGMLVLRWLLNVACSSVIRLPYLNMDRHWEVYLASQIGIEFVPGMVEHLLLAIVRLDILDNFKRSCSETGQLREDACVVDEANCWRWGQVYSRLYVMAVRWSPACFESHSNCRTVLPFGLHPTSILAFQYASTSNILFNLFATKPFHVRACQNDPWSRLNGYAHW